MPKPRSTNNHRKGQSGQPAENVNPNQYLRILNDRFGPAETNACRRLSTNRVGLAWLHVVSEGEDVVLVSQNGHYCRHVRLGTSTSARNTHVRGRATGAVETGLPHRCPAPKKLMACRSFGGHGRLHNSGRPPSQFRWNDKLRICPITSSRMAPSKLSAPMPTIVSADVCQGTPGRHLPATPKRPHDQHG